MKKILLFAAAACSLFDPVNSSLAQGTAFTYQGQLNSAGAPASGSFDLAFSLFDATTNGNLIAGPLTNSAIAVSNGLFAVMLDFGNQFPGASRWLQIGVRTNGGGTFATLSPRQQLTSTPYAIQAANAASAGSVVATNISGTLPASQLPPGVLTNGGSGTGLTGVALLNGGNSFSGNQLVNDGNLGIGTNNPPAPLYVQGAAQSLGASFGSSGAIVGVQTSGNAPSGGGVYGISMVPGGNGIVGEADVPLPGATGPGGGNIAVYGESYATTGTAVYGGAFAYSGVTYGVVGEVNSLLGYAGYFQGRSYFSGNVGIGALNPAANLQIANSSGVGVFVGDLSPFGAAAFETDYTTPRTHAWFAENGTNVFNVTAGGSGYFAGTVSIGGGNNPNGVLNLNTPGFPGVTALLRARAGDSLPLAVQGTNGVNFLLVHTNGEVDISGNAYAVSFNPTSDRNAKENFQPVSPQEVLARVASLPIQEWNFKTDTHTRHIGPMAQDFYTAFGVGPDDKHIATVDADGVALAAIQGLNQKMETQNAELRSENAELKRANQELEQKLNALQSLVQEALKRP